VKYPNLYASKENCEDEKSIRLFNCVQRGHQNSLEILPTFLTLLVLAGLEVFLFLYLLLAPDFYCELRCLSFCSHFALCFAANVILQSVLFSLAKLMLLQLPRARIANRMNCKDGKQAQGT
jgi:hypothetical protein